jgi:hypothetical protein
MSVQVSKVRIQGFDFNVLGLLIGSVSFFSTRDEPNAPNERVTLRLSSKIEPLELSQPCTIPALTFLSTLPFTYLD